MKWNTVGQTHAYKLYNSYTKQAQTNKPKKSRPLYSTCRRSFSLTKYYRSLHVEVNKAHCYFGGAASVVAAEANLKIIGSRR